MARKTFLYYLFDSNKKPLYVDGNNNVQQANHETFEKPDGQQAHLKYSPEGWKDTLVKYARNIKYWGLFRDMSVPMKFVGDGARILRHLMWQFGIEGICYLGILKLDRTAVPYLYETWYNSEINFSKVRDIERGVHAEALEGGLSKLLKANENTTYEIPIDEDDQHINVLMDGMEFDFNRKFSLTTDQACYGTANFYLGMVETSREGRAPEHLFQDIFHQPSSAYPNDRWFHRFDAPVASVADMDLVITGTVKVYYDESVTPFIRAEVNDGIGISSVQTVLWSAAGTAGSTIDVTINSTITVPAGSRAHIKLLGGNPASSDPQFTIKEGELSIDYVYTHPGTYIKALRAYRLFEKLVEKMTDGKYTVTSTFLSALTDYCITSGDALRKIENSVIKTSFNDFFKSLFVRFSIGLGIDESGGFGNEKLMIEQFANFFGSTIITDLGQVAGAEIAVAEDLIHNTIKAGYAKQEYTDANGKAEFNQGQLYSTPITRIIKELDMQSPYRADPFGIELLRINYDQKKTTDTNSDNDTFFLNIDTTLQTDTETDPDTDYYELNRPAFSSITGLPHPNSAFNVLLSPQYGLKNNGAYLHSIFDLLETEKIKFQTSDKNATLSTTLAGVTVTENADISIGGLPAQLFRPYYFTLKTQVPVNLLTLINTSPYGKIKFTWNERTWYGYLVDGGIKPGTEDAQTWKLLCSPENDLSKFNS